MNAAQALQGLEQKLVEAGIFFGHGTDNAHDEAWWLMHHVLYGSDAFRDIPADLEIRPASLELMDRLAATRIATRKPLAYLTGTAWFAGLPFTVNEHVLVPRSPIAELIDQEFNTLLEQPPRRILDLCTGSGCIGIACAMAFPEAEVVLSDISEQALKVAASNIARHQLGGRVSTVRADLFSGLEGRFDLIVSNPPYVSRSEYEELPQEFHLEPELGLVTDREGLDIPLRILAEAPNHLSEEGVLILETGNTWEALASARSDLGFLWLEFEHGGHGVCAITASGLTASEGTARS